MTESVDAGEDASMDADTPDGSLPDASAADAQTRDGSTRDDASGLLDAGRDAAVRDAASSDAAADACTPRTFWLDDDDDGFGDEDVPMSACAAPDGFVDNDGDCDDASDAVFPGAPESCNGVDDDCDGSRDNEAGFVCVRSESIACTSACGSIGSGTCTSTCQPPDEADCTPPAETCNAVDDDCDGMTDNDLPTFSGPVSTTLPASAFMVDIVRYEAAAGSFGFVVAASTHSGDLWVQRVTPTGELSTALQLNVSSSILTWSVASTDRELIAVWSQTGGDVYRAKVDITTWTVSLTEGLLYHAPATASFVDVSANAAWTLVTWSQSGNIVGKMIATETLPAIADPFTYVDRHAPVTATPWSTFLQSSSRYYIAYADTSASSTDLDIYVIRNGTFGSNGPRVVEDNAIDDFAPELVRGPTDGTSAALTWHNNERIRTVFLPNLSATSPPDDELAATIDPDTFAPATPAGALPLPTHSVARDDAGGRVLLTYLSGDFGATFVRRALLRDRSLETVFANESDISRSAVSCLGATCTPSVHFQMHVKSLFVGSSAVVLVAEEDVAPYFYRYGCP